MDAIINFGPIHLSIVSILLIIIPPVSIVIIDFLTNGGVKRFIWNFFNTPYKKIEVIHDGIVRDIFYVLNDEIKDGVYTTKSGKKYPLKDIFNPIHERSNCIRYTFKNDNVLPYLTITDDVSTIKGINNYEIITKTKDKKVFIISNFWLKNLLEEHFVEKIKKEAKTGWEAILEWLKTPSGGLAILGLFILIGIALFVNRH
jgi:hypothetical protein